MPRIKIQHKGNFKNSESFFSRMMNKKYLLSLEKYGKEGVRALSSATPVDSGKTASSWDYTITNTKTGIAITWVNTNVVNGVPIAVILQYGHGTKNGGYVQGLDYINPALRPIFDKILNEAWREVTA